MPLQTKLFNATTTSLSASGNANKVYTVGGRIKGLSGLVGATEANALRKGLEALASDGITLYPQGSTHPDDSAVVLTNVLLAGRSADSLEVRLRYETPTGFPGTALIYEVDSSLQSVQRDKYPVTNLPIFVGWQGRTTDGGPAQPISAKIPRDTAPFSYLRPVIRISATLIRAGVLDDTTTVANASSIGVVNDRLWMGREAGSWLMTEYRSSSSRYAGTYSVRASAISKKGEDWRVLDLLRSRTTGRLAIPDSTKITDALASNYAFGQFGSGYDPTTDGFVQQGPYEMTNFADLWSVLIQ